MSQPADSPRAAEPSSDGPDSAPPTTEAVASGLAAQSAEDRAELAAKMQAQQAHDDELVEALSRRAGTTRGR